MVIVDKVNKYIKVHPEILFFIKLISFYFSFDYFNYFWTGLCVPGNLYSQFADKYLNYHDYLKSSMSSTVGFFSDLLGYKTTFIKDRISVVNGFGVVIADACSGIGIMSVWAAFALAFPANTKKKVKWLIGGLFAIWFINVIRIFALLIAVNQGKNVDINKFGEHHDVFNAFAYGLIVLMIYFYTKSSSKKPQKTKQ